MSEVWLIVEEWVDASGELVAAPVSITVMVEALKQAIEASPTQAMAPSGGYQHQERLKVRVVGAKTLGFLSSQERDLIDLESGELKDIIFCPLTLDLPTTLPLPAQSVYQACRDISALRLLVEQKLGYLTGQGNFWLPVVLTAKGPLYAETIGSISAGTQPKFPKNNISDEDWRDVAENVSSYYQPFHLSDAQRQQIYQLGFRLLEYLSAPPATYLVQFGFEGQEIYFDRLWPFPAAPAIASLGVQDPNLFVCHWYCLTGFPLFDLTIPSTAFLTPILH